MTPAFDVTALIQGLEFMATMGLSEYDELRTALAGVVIARHAALVDKALTLSPPRQTH